MRKKEWAIVVVFILNVVIISSLVNITFNSGDPALVFSRDATWDVRSLAWSPDGKWLATGREDTIIQIWDTQTWQVSNTIDSEGVWALTWSPDGRYLAAKSSPLEIWDTVSNQMTAAIPTSVGIDWLWTDDGKLLNWGFQTGPEIWNASTYTLEASFSENEVPWSYNQGRLAIVDPDQNAIVIEDIHTKEILALLSGHTGTINALQWSPDGAMLASASADKTVRLWNPSRATPLQVLAHPYAVLAVAWQSNQLLASVSGDEAEQLSGADNRIHIWNTERGEEQQVFAVADVFRVADPRTILSPTSVIWNPSGNRIAARGYPHWTRGDNWIYEFWVWTVPDGNLIIDAEIRPVFISWNPKGDMVATVSADGSVNVWNTTIAP